jgi:photosystem II stability/assembly factor-like uncharacterized protein
MFRGFIHRVCLATVALFLSDSMASWNPVQGVGGGWVVNFVSDGSRVCGGTKNGVYCLGENQKVWQPTYLPGKRVQGVSRTNSGWVVTVLGDSSRVMHVVSLDEGKTWKEVGDARNNLINSIINTFGDSVIRYERDSARTVRAMLSVDGGENWVPIRHPDSGRYLGTCTPSDGSILCVSDKAVFRQKQGNGNLDWDTIGILTSEVKSEFNGGRVFIVDPSGNLSVYGAQGVERQLRLPSGFQLLSVTGEGLVANSESEIAFVGANDVIWKRRSTPYPIGFPSIISGDLGVAYQDKIIIPSNSGGPYLLSIGEFVAELEPLFEGLPNGYSLKMKSQGDELLVANTNSIWKQAYSGKWTAVYDYFGAIYDFWIGSNWIFVKQYGQSDYQTRISLDNSATWMEPLFSPSGEWIGIVQSGDSVLAITTESQLASNQERWVSNLHVASGPGGPWAKRKTLTGVQADGFFACGSRLFLSGDSMGMHLGFSDDKGETWIKAPLKEVFEPNGARMYGIGASDALLLSQDCGDTWSQVQIPWSAGSTVASINTAEDEPLALVMDSNFINRVYPLPGASSKWRGTDAYPLPWGIGTLHLHQGVLYAALNSNGLYAFNSPAALHQPRHVHDTRGSTLPSKGWHRIDGRTISSDFPARTPRFRKRPNP